MVNNFTVPISDLGAEVTEEEKQSVEAAKKDLQDALAGTDLEQIKQKKEALEKAAQGIAVKAYEKVQKEQQAKEEGTSSSSDDDQTVEADYEDIK